MSEPNARRGRIIAFSALGVVTLMLGASFAAVPLYRLFCAATGYGGTTQVGTSAPATQGQRRINVRFDTNISAGLPWRLEAETASVTVRTGETATVFFKVSNDSDHEVRAVASFNVSPDQAGSYFTKIACFCFDEQVLKARESAEWPVVFFLDPALEKDETMARVDGLTLSYTMFASKMAPKTGADAGVAKPKS